MQKKRKVANEALAMAIVEQNQHKNLTARGGGPRTRR